jgi:hypothetical protein
MTDPIRMGQPKRSLFDLIGTLPGLIADLIRAELDRFKAEMGAKAKRLGIGSALLAVAAVFAYFAIQVLVVAAILGIAVALPAWLAALIVAAALLIITGIVAAIGVAQLRRGTPPTPSETMESVKDDVRAFRGMGKRESS